MFVEQHIRNPENLQTLTNQYIGCAYEGRASYIPETLLRACIQFLLKLEISSISKDGMLSLILLTFPKLPNAFHDAIWIFYLIQSIVVLPFRRVFTSCGGTFIRSRFLTLSVDVETWKCCNNELNQSNVYLDFITIKSGR